MRKAMPIILALAVAPTGTAAANTSHDGVHGAAAGPDRRTAMRAGRERFPEWRDPAAVEACANTKIPIRPGWMHPRNGRRLPVRPPGLSAP
jgi:hypothetical protein